MKMINLKMKSDVNKKKKKTKIKKIRKLKMIIQ